jgi:hypothetical protein
MDLSRPVLDGWEAARRIKAAPETSAIPIIALTAHVMPGDQENALAAGCDDFDTKPVELQRLLGKIRALAPRAKILLHETWSYPPWDKRLAKFGFDQKEMYARLHAAYGAMAAKYGFDVIPVGTAAEYIPNREALFKKGDSHFGREGVYLQGLTFTASLYGVDVGKCPYRPKWMSPSRAEEMRSAVLSAGAANLPARLPPTGAPSKK